MDKVLENNYIYGLAISGPQVHAWSWVPLNLMYDMENFGKQLKAFRSAVKRGTKGTVLLTAHSQYSAPSLNIIKYKNQDIPMISISKKKANTFCYDPNNTGKFNKYMNFMKPLNLYI